MGMFSRLLCKLADLKPEKRGPVYRNPVEDERSAHSIITNSDKCSVLRVTNRTLAWRAWSLGTNLCKCIHWPWWCMSVIPALGEVEAGGFRYIRPYLKERKKNQRPSLVFGPMHMALSNVQNVFGFFSGFSSCLLSLNKER